MAGPDGLHSRKGDRRANRLTDPGRASQPATRLHTLATRLHTLATRLHTLATRLHTLATRLHTPVRSTTTG